MEHEHGETGKNPQSWTVVIKVVCSLYYAVAIRL